MRMDSFKNLDEMSEKELLKLIVSNQMYLLYRINKIETKLKNEKSNSSDVVIKDGLDKVMSFSDQINKFLEKNATADE